MYKLLISLAIIGNFALSAAAQSEEAKRVEVFAGYSLTRTNYKVERSLPTEPVVTFFNPKQTLNGFNASATGYLTNKIGLTGDFSAHFTTKRLTDPLGGNINISVNLFNIVGGPQYKFRNKSRVTPFVRSLAGVAVTRGRLGLTRVAFSETTSATNFALMLGGGLDVSIGKRFDLRLAQVDYNPIFLRRGNAFGFGQARADNIRFSFGVVFK